MATRFTIAAIFQAVDKVTAPVSRMQNRVMKFTRSMRRGFVKLNRTIGKFASGIKRAAAVGTVALVGIGFVLRDLITTGADFGRAIGSAAAKFPDQIKRGTKEFRELEKAARDVGTTTEFTAIQAAKGLNFLAKAGFDATFSTKILADIVDFATASEIELAEAADIASDALGAFGLDSTNLSKKMEGMRRIMDVMSLTANSTNTSVAELFEAMKKGGPIAVQAGSNIETFSALMGVLASNGIKAALAGTAAKNVTLALAGVGNKAAVTFKRLGISLEDSNGNMRDQLDVLDDLRKKLKPFGTKRKVGIIAAIFGKIPIAAAAVLLSKTGENVRKLRVELEKAGGSSKRTAAFIRDDVKGSLDGLISSIEGVKISIFSLNEGPLKETINKMTDWIRTNEKLIATNIGGFLLDILNNLPSIWKWIKRIGVALAIFFTFAAILKTIGAVLLILSLPFGAITLGVLALGAAFVAIIVFIDEANTMLENMPFAIRLVLAPLELLIKTIKLAKDIFSGEIGAKLGEAIFNITNDKEIDPNEALRSVNARIASPQDRIARSIEEQRTTSTAEITIKDDTGRAEITKGKLGPSLSLQSTGGL